MKELIELLKTKETFLRVFDSQIKELLPKHLRDKYFDEIIFTEKLIIYDDSYYEHDNRKVAKKDLFTLTSLYLGTYYFYEEYIENFEQSYSYLHIFTPENTIYKDERKFK